MLLRQTIVLLLILSSFAVLGQSGNYKLNIVKVNNGDYGFIIGSSNKGDCYFVMIRSKSEPLDKEFTVSINESLKQAPARQVDILKVHDYHVSLYKIDNPHFNHRREYYGNLDTGASGFFTFTDMSADDELTLGDGNSPVSYKSDYVDNNQLSIFTPQESGVFNRGMPVVDNKNNVVGIIMDSKFEDVRAFRVLKMTALAGMLKKIEDRDDKPCTYFNFLYQGQQRNPCEEEAFRDKAKKDSLELERKARIALDKRQRKAYRLSKINSWSWGPAVGAYCNFSNLTSSSNGLGGEDPTTWKYSFGANIYLRPDAGKVRFTLKPRYSMVEVTMPDEYASSPFGGFGMYSYKYNQYELPVQLEFGVNRQSDISFYFALGYSPAYQSDYTLKYNDNSKYGEHTADSTGGLTHNVYGEFGMEGKRFRFSMNIGQQLGSFKARNYSFSPNGSAVYPFEVIDKFPVFFGVDLAIRLKGIWGIKHKQAPSKFLK